MVYIGFSIGERIGGLGRRIELVSSSMWANNKGEGRGGPIGVGYNNSRVYK